MTRVMMVAIKNNAKTQLVFLVVHLILRVSVVMCIDGSPCCILCSINLFTLLPVHLILRPACLTLSQSPPSLSPSITPSAFYSRLKTHLLHKIISTIVFLVPCRLPSQILDLDRT